MVSHHGGFASAVPLYKPSLFMHGLSPWRLCLIRTTVQTDPKFCVPLQSLRAAESAPNSGRCASPHTLRGGAFGLALPGPECATAKECWCRRATHAASYELRHHLLSFFHVRIKWCQTDSSFSAWNSQPFSLTCCVLCQTDSSFSAWNSQPFSLTCCVLYTCFKKNA